MSNHTPGPWHQHSARPERIIVNGSCVYEVRDTTTDGGFAGNGEGMPNPQDVRLMATAPELLVALERAAFLMDRIANSNPMDITAFSKLGDAAAESLRAIAKATGEGRGE